MTYKDTLKHLLTKYPLLYKNRLQVDEFLFATIDNGYEWINGELIDIIDSRDTPISQEDAAIRLVNETLEDGAHYSLWNSFKYNRENPRYDAKHITILVDNEKNRIVKGLSNIFNTKSRMNDYSGHMTVELGNYCHLMDIPDNIKRDWKMAVIKFINWCITNVDYVTICEKQDTKKYLTNLRNQVRK
jgi:hypothetical protein